MRKVIALRLLESKTTIPHYYLNMKVNMDATLKLREELNKVSKVKISVNDFIVKACALALRDVPEVNSQWWGTYIRKFSNADISIAVSTDNGLITPIVFNAGAKGLSAIAETTKALAEKARTHKLKPQEY
jgi:pyruvate dehydrogenase E2 component (dihydrolipoamide acetyltransferase)